MYGAGDGRGGETQGYRGKHGQFMKGTGGQTNERGLYLVGQSFPNHTPWNTKGLFKKDW